MVVEMVFVVYVVLSVVDGFVGVELFGDVFDVVWIIFEMILGEVEWVVGFL